MHYYEVLVSSPRYHGHKALTYESESVLSSGTVLSVALQNQLVLGVVQKSVDKPSFKSKPVNKVISENAVSKELLELISWLADYYPAPIGQLMGLLLPSGLLQTKRRNKNTSILNKQSGSSLPKLTEEQTYALNTIINNAPQTTFLHGNTGSGKTRVYIELVRSMLEENKSAIVLTPEIGLTPQLVNSFREAFPENVYLLHSDLTPAQRRDSWLAIANSITPLIVIGPRSALFSPVKNIGLIVLDEAHDSAYKQEQAPYYQTTRVAAKLGEIHKAKVVLGSATPLVSDYYVFRSKKLPIIRMNKQAVKNTKKTAKSIVVNLRDRAEFTRSNWISDKLITALSESIEAKQQALVFLNRRGTARLVLCQVCGWQATCPRCDLPLTYHGDKHVMQCHTCGFRQSPPSACPECSATDIVFRSVGTKSIVSELGKLFPKARISRFDSDTLKSDSLESQYEQVRSGDIDFLVGTQVLGKGLDLPRLTTLGIVIADTSLSFPDYTAEERTFQMLTQVLGRINRGHLAGQAIIQSYRPENTAVQAALNEDYESFYEHQIEQREKFGFPPFSYVLKLHCSRASISAAKQAAEQLSETLLKKRPRARIVGPSPSFVEKKNNKYQWQIIVMSPERKELVDIISELPSNWHYDIDPTHLL